MKLTNHLKTALCLSACVVLVGCSGTRYSRSSGQWIDDKAISGRVNSALARDSLVNAGEIKVRTFRGNTQLTGFVDHPVQKERAAQITRNVEGVQWFKNDIVVKSELPGARMAANGQFMSEPAGTARQGQQQQFGQQQYQQSYQQQSPQASQRMGEGWQRGAQNIYAPEDYATPNVRSSQQTQQQRTQQQPGAGIATEPAGAASLQQRVQSQLESTNPDAAQNIRVESADNGKIVLRGTVRSREEKRAIENSVESIQGVRSVDNKLEVQE